MKTCSKKFMGCCCKCLQHCQRFEFIVPLAMRLFLVPVLWMAATSKLGDMHATIQWFGNSQWGLGLPFPTFLAYLAAYIELIGCACLLAGFATRFITVPLMITMLTAAFTVHVGNGWATIAPHGAEAAQRLQGLLGWLQQHFPEHHAYVTKLGQPVILNNGIEFAATYFIMLLSLFFSGAGRFVSLDYWIKKRCSSC